MQFRRSIVLAAAFAALLLVIGCSGYLGWRSAIDTQRRVAAIHDSDSRAGDALEAIRLDVYRSGILGRDYLLESESEPVPVDQYDKQFAELRADGEQQFRILTELAKGPEQVKTLRRLRAELDAYWNPSAQMWAGSPEQQRHRRLNFLRTRGKRRGQIIDLTGNAEDMLTRSFAREQDRITSANQSLNISLGWIVGTSVFLGLIIAGLTLLRLMALERQSQAAESELRRLSGQIRTAQELERKYLSRELHDQVGQMLTGLRMELAGMERLNSDSHGELASRMAHSKGIVEQTLKIVRNIAMLLRPSMLDDLGLAPALAWLVKEMSRSSGIEIQADVDPVVDTLPDAHRTCLYRVVQEALTNASRHSSASTIKVTVRADGPWIRGEIADDGRGFEPAPRGAILPGIGLKGLGLKGMEERVRELGGLLRVVTAPGAGVRIEIRIPQPSRGAPPPEVEFDSSIDRGRSRDRADRLEASAESH